MNVRRKLLAGVLALAGFLFFPLAAKAQNFGLGATVSPTNATLNSSILFTVNLTNLDTFPIDNVYVTNALSGEAILNGATNTQFGLILTTNTPGVVFRINTLIVGAVAQMTVSLTPRNAGPYTNQIIIATPFAPSITNTSVIANITAPSTDLAVGLTNASGILVNDTTVIGLSVTNLGPSTATGVALNNTMPPSFKLLSISPTNSYTFTNGNLVLDLGTLTSGATRQFQVSVQPTNAVTNFNLIASVSAGSILETNAGNNIVTNVISVSDLLSTNLTVTEVSQLFNHQTGLREMQVQLSNVGTNDVPAARVIVSGLTNSTWLYNAVGTNNGAAYVLYNTNLAAGASVPLLLEFYVIDRTTLTNRTLSAVGVPAINLGAGTNGVNASITNSSGGIMIEFTATPGKTYTIIYASDSTFSNALTAQPSIVAPANRVQWIDNGPPKTISHPSTTPSRVYRVFQSQ